MLSKDRQRLLFRLTVLADKVDRYSGFIHYSSGLDTHRSFYLDLSQYSSIHQPLQRESISDSRIYCRWWCTMIFWRSWVNIFNMTINLISLVVSLLLNFVTMILLISVMLRRRKIASFVIDSSDNCYTYQNRGRAYLRVKSRDGNVVRKSDFRCCVTNTTMRHCVLDRISPVGFIWFSRIIFGKLVC